MRRSERKSPGGPPGKAALEEAAVAATSTAATMGEPEPLQPNGAPELRGGDGLPGHGGGGGPPRPVAAPAATQGDRRSTESEVYDDGTNTFFWEAHTLTVLFILTCTLGYVTLLEETPQDTAYNTKRGIVASILVFLCFGVTQAKDGPFSRPHPETGQQRKLTGGKFCLKCGAGGNCFRYAGQPEIQTSGS